MMLTGIFFPWPVFTLVTSLFNINAFSEGMIGTLRVYTSRLATKESYWIFHKDGDDFDLKVSDPKSPSYLLIANDPEMEGIIGALLSLIHI